MPHRKHSEIVAMVLQLGDRIGSLQTENLYGFTDEDLHLLVAAFAEERRTLEERHLLVEEALAFFVVALKQRGETHLAIQRRMRRPEDLPDASQITRLVRRWQPILEDLGQHALTDTAPQHSAFLGLINSAQAAEEQRSNAPELTPLERARAAKRATALRSWDERLRVLRATALGLGLMLAGGAAMYAVTFNSSVELTQLPGQLPATTVEAKNVADTAPPPNLCPVPVRKARKTPKPVPAVRITVTVTATPRPPRPVAEPTPEPAYQVLEPLPTTAPAP